MSTEAQKRIRIVYVGRDIDYEPPFGWRVIHVYSVVETHNGGCGNVSSSTSHYAVIEEVGDLQAMIEVWRNHSQDRLEAERDRLDGEFADKMAAEIKKLSLMQTFSDLVQKFPIGSSAYYYDQGPYITDDISGNIRSIKVHRITYEGTTEVSIKDDEHATLWVSSSDGYNKAKASSLFRTAEECAAANRAKHDEKLMAVKESRKKEAEESRRRDIERAKKIIEEAGKA